MRIRSNRLAMTSILYWRGILALMVVITMMSQVSCTLLGHKPEAALNNDSVWPHDRSDLTPDNKIEFGQLDNGLRYIIRENRTPRDRVSMHLYVQVGSLYERENEQGAAHFLEHMLFNGSKNFPPGEMVKYFQRIGMQFGPDANAHTGFDQTVYDVLLPKGDLNSLSEGLLVLRDYADGALLLPEEVEREKKVVLAEMRSRDSSRFRTVKAAFKFEMPGLIFGNRFPIGEADFIRQFDHQLLRNFYEAWYRPERMFLVIVGDIEKETARQLIEKQFSDLRPKQSLRDLPDIGRMTHRGIKGFHHYEKDAGATNVSIETILQDNPPQDAKAYQHERMIKDLANMMMQKRLDQVVRGQKTFLTSANVVDGYYLKHIKYSEIGGQTNPENWQSAVAEIEQVLRKAIVHGFTPAELKRSKDEYKADLIKAQKEEDTRNSKTIAREIMTSIGDWYVLQSPRQRANLLLAGINAVTLEQVNQAFVNIWSADHRLVMVTGNTELASDPIPPESRILTTYLSSSKIAVEPPEEKQTGQFPYLPEPLSSGRIRHKEEIKDLGITKVLFENGITLFLKPTKFKENKIQAALSFGDGRASEPKNQPGLAKLTEMVVNESGFGKMDRTSLDDALAGRLASIGFEIRENMFMVEGQSTSKELPLLFQLLQASVLDPGFRENSRLLAIKRYGQEYLSMSKRVEGVVELKGRKFLAGGDNRLGFPQLEHLKQRTLDQIKTWMQQQLNDSPMELALVGDFEVEHVINLAAQYIGSLSKRNQKKTDLPVSGPRFPEGEMLKLSIRTQIPKALVVVAYPTEDFWDIQRTRRLSIMAELYSERLRQQIREKLGAAYSPYAYNRSFRAYKGYGMTQVVVQVDPKMTQRIVDELRQISEHLRSQDVDLDEFRRVLDPALTHIKDLRQKNEYWLNSVLTGAARYPQQLDWARTLETDYASINIDEISSLARKYLVNDQAATIIISPKKDKPNDSPPN